MIPDPTKIISRHLFRIFGKIKEVTASELIIDEAFSSNIDFIKTVLARASSIVEQRSEETTKKITKFASMRSIPNSYDNELKKLVSKKEFLGTITSKKLATEGQLYLHNEKINIKENDKKNSLRKLLELESINKKIKSYDQLEIKIKQSNMELEKAVNRYETNKPQLIKLEKRLRLSEELQEKYNKIRLSENSLAQNREISRNMRKALDDWRKYRLDIEKYEKIKSSIHSKISEIQKKLDTEKASKKAVEVAHKHAIAHFENLSKASQQFPLS
jgi:hypothetical protein